MTVEIQGEVLTLFAQKAMYWEKEGALLLADLHLGKVTHFRKAGIPVPVKASDRNIELLIELIQQTQPKRVICLGDLFHSHYNPEWEIFGEVVKHFRAITFELVIGNHDIMSSLQYERKHVHVVDGLRLGPFVMTHHPLENVPAGWYNLAGHIHPGASLRGRGRQSLMLPCFYFGKQLGLLPAFGMFTGMARIDVQKSDRVFVIAEEMVIDVSAPAPQKI